MGRNANCFLYGLCALIVFATHGHPTAHAEDAKAIAFFESKIRPVLIEHCYRCHSIEADEKNKLRGGLYLDSQSGLLTGGDSGPAIVPGKPTESLLLRSMQYDHDVKMPPAGKLAPGILADFEKWIAEGAIDPRKSATLKKQIGLTIDEGRQFWAYKLPVAAPSPEVKQTDWPRGEIDRFILSKLESKQLSPSSDADRATLIRRVYFDLIGLPPTPEQIAAFVQDKSPDAYEKLVDRLLAAPEFGERWARHWLDVSRYAESVTLRGLVFKQAWRYRDYTIDAFNRDVPFDQFIREQIAGDLLPTDNPEERARRITATAFLVLGNTNLEEQDKDQLRMDVVDEQLDVITRGFMGQTVSCARCHDHKFDPIPTKDYYALAGILRNAKVMEHANVSAWTEVSLPVDPKLEQQIAAKERRIAELNQLIKVEKAKAGGKAATGVLPVSAIKGIVVDDEAAKKVGEWQHSVHSGSYIGAGYVHDQNAGKGQKTLSFEPELPETGRYEVRLAYSHGTSRSKKVPVTIFSAEGEKTIHVDMAVAPPIDGRFVSLGTYRFEKTGQSFVIIANEGTSGHVTADAVVFIPLDAAATSDTAKAPASAAITSQARLKQLETELKSLQAQGPFRPKAMAPMEEAKIEDTHVHIRGNVHNLGELSPRGFLQVATYGEPPSIPKDQSGRLQLAEWIASTNNPLTARVIANRTWHWLMGSGIVRTVDNFGTTGELPSHPELLDHLALSFMDNGWSMKALIRSIVLSRTYQQSSALQLEQLRIDPENRLFGRANRRRLDAESIRDAMLSISNNLDPQRGGATFSETLAADYGYNSSKILRRSIYLPAFRNAMPELLEIFDMADSSLVTGRRNTSTVAPQALFMMNNPFVMDRAQAAAARILGQSTSDNDRITHTYLLVLGRQPTDGERKITTHYLKSQPDAAKAWEGLFHALFASADFRFID